MAAAAAAAWGRALRGPQPQSGDASERPGAAGSPVVVWFEGPVLVQAQVLGLLIAQLREVGIEGGEVKAGHVLIWTGGGQGGGRGGEGRRRQGMRTGREHGITPGTMIRTMGQND